MERKHYIRFFLKNSYHVLRYHLFHKKKNLERFLNQRNITLSFSNDLLKRMIESGEPFAAIRFGAVELSCVNNYEKIQLLFKKHFKSKVKYSIKNNAGVFPNNDKMLNRYAQIAIKSFQKATILGISGIHMEDYFYCKYCPHAHVIQYEAFEPLRGDWIQSLAHKKVLVISPFAEDIQKQYQRINLLFPPGIVPSFNLVTIKAVQTLGEALDDRFSDWEEALHFMENEIMQKDFDIALVGAGAYGSPLCTFISALGKQAIQTGGATPTMFGIMARRWENREHVCKYQNEYWIHPSSKPDGYRSVENGCYW